MRKIHYFIYFNLWFIFISAFADIDKPFLSIPSHQFSLKTGLHCILAKQSTSPMVSLRLFVKAGSLTEGDYQNSGISHLLEHICFKGSENFSETEISKEVNLLGGNLNAYTTFDRTVYEINIPKQHLTKGLTLLRDLVFFLRPDENELQREKKVVMREMDMNEDDPSGYTFHTLMFNLYQNTPIRYPVIGDRRILNNLNFKDLENYHARFYVPSNMVLVIVGDIDDFSTMENTLEEILKTIPHQEKGVPMIHHCLESRELKKEIHTRHPQLSSNLLLMGWKTVPFEHADSPSLEIASVLIDKYLNDALKSELNDQGISYNATAYHYASLFQGFFAIESDVDQLPPKDIQNSIHSIVNRIAKGDFSESDISHAKTQIYSSLLQSLGSQADIAEWLGNGYLLSNQIHTFDDWFKHISSVSKQELRDAAKKYLSHKHCVSVICEPGIQESPATNSLASYSFRDQEPFVYNVSPSFKVIAWQNTSIPLVYFDWIFPRGATHEFDTHLPYLHILSQLWGKASKKNSAKEVTTQWQGWGGEVSPYYSYHGIGLSAFGLSKYFVPMLKDLHTMVLQPEFDRTDISITKQELSLEYEQSFKNPARRAFLEMREMLFPEHPLGNNIPRVISVWNHISPHDLQHYHQSLVGNEQSILTITGDFDVHTLNTLIETLKKSQPSHHTQTPPIISPPASDPPIAKNIMKTIEIDPSAQFFIALGWKVSTQNATEQLYFEVLESYLSEQSSPLFIELREKKGLAYRLGAVHDPNLQLPGIFTLYAGTDSSENALLIHDAMIQMLTQIVEGSLTEDMFHTAKEVYKGSLSEFYENPSNISTALSIHHLYGISPEYILQRFDKVDSLDFKTFVKLIDSHLVKPNHVSVVTGKGLHDNRI